MNIDLPPPSPSDTVLFGVDFPAQTMAWDRGKTIAEQIRQSCLRAVSGLYRPGLVLHLSVLVEGDCPEKQVGKVLLAAGEMTTNAIQHGLYGRSFGRIDIHLTVERSGPTLLNLYDNGWGFDPSFREGRGWRLFRTLGKVSVQASDQRPGSLVSLQFQTQGR